MAEPALMFLSFVLFQQFGLLIHMLLSSDTCTYFMIIVILYITCVCTVCAHKDM